VCPGRKIAKIHALKAHLKPLMAQITANTSVVTHFVGMLPTFLFPVIRMFLRMLNGHPTRITDAPPQTPHD
jgi:hypothetical protein